jgi:hypothetical protein
MSNWNQMIKPDRHTNPDYSVINISAFLLNVLNANYSISYDDLLIRVIETLGEKSQENYPYALNFLFLLGKIRYIKETDSFTSYETK